MRIVTTYAFFGNAVLIDLCCNNDYSPIATRYSRKYENCYSRIGPSKWYYRELIKTGRSLFTFGDEE